MTDRRPAESGDETRKADQRIETPVERGDKYHPGGKSVNKGGNVLPLVAAEVSMGDVMRAPQLSARRHRDQHVLSCTEMSDNGIQQEPRVFEVLKDIAKEYEIRLAEFTNDVVRRPTYA